MNDPDRELKFVLNLVPRTDFMYRVWGLVDNPFNSFNTERHPENALKQGIHKKYAVKFMMQLGLTERASRKILSKLKARRRYLVIVKEKGFTVAELAKEASAR